MQKTYKLRICGFHFCTLGGRRLPKENLKKKAYDTIKEKIFDCEFLPSTFLNETMLMSVVGTSRTPIREALNKLEQEKLVKILPKKGIVVSEITIRDITAVYQVRELVEPYIIRTWGMNIPVNTLQKYKERTQDSGTNDSMEDQFLLDDAFHRVIINACDNSYLFNLLCNVYDQNHRIRIISGRLQTRLEESAHEHLKIIEYLLDKKYEEAALTMGEHLAQSKKAAFESMLAGNGYKL